MNAALTPLYRVRRSLDGREPDRVPIFDIYSGEQAPVSAVNLPRTTSESAICLLSADLTPRYPVRILDRDGQAIVQTTPYGGVCRVRGPEVGPLEILDYPVKSRVDWAFVSRRLGAAPDRVDWAAVRSDHERARTAGLCIALAAPTGFRVCAAYTGFQRLQEMMGADPGLVRDMADSYASLLTGVADLLLAGGCDVDVVLLFDDLADRRRTHLSAQRYRETFAPAGRRLSDFFHRLGIKVIFYSCGDVRMLVPDLVETGVDCLGPLEATAGMDLRVLKLNHGADLAFLGGIDRRALEDPDPAVLEREVASKVSAGMVNGRYIAGFDGPLPLTTTAEQYAQATKLLAQYGKY